MRVFASWSGPPSRQVAVLFRDWIPSVLQDVEVYVSSQDIAKGERWLSSVNDNLETHDFGLSIITPGNLNAPWILFEAGALAKSLKSRLVPVLCGLDSIKVTNHPLSQFQYVLAPQENEVFRMLESINAASSKPLGDDRLAATFKKWFPDFKEQFEAIDLGGGKASKNPDPASENAAIAAVLNDVLRELRDLRQQVRGPTFKTQSASEYLKRAFRTDEGVKSELAELFRGAVDEKMKRDITGTFVVGNPPHSE